jgi:hypothetical protein
MSDFLNRFSALIVDVSSVSQTFLFLLHFFSIDARGVFSRMSAPAAACVLLMLLMLLAAACCCCCLLLQPASPLTFFPLL